MLRHKIINRTLASLVVGLAAGVSSIASAQCPGGNCGSMYPDGHGGFASAGFGAGSASGSQWGYRHAQPLFDNHFTQGYANQAEAGLYIAPVGVPGWVGHTYITNQAFYPHQYLYAHHDRYHSYYDNGRGMNRTSAHYYSPPVRTGLGYIGRQFSLPRY
jgi:hypothetical protein